MSANRHMRRAAAKKGGGVGVLQQRYEALKYDAIAHIHGKVGEIIVKDAYYRTMCCMLEVLCHRFNEIRTKEGREQKACDLFFEEMQKLKKAEPELFDYEDYLFKHFGITKTYFEEGKQYDYTKDKQQV